MSNAKKHTAEAGRLITEAATHSRAGEAWRAIGLLARAFVASLDAVKAAAEERAEMAKAGSVVVTFYGPVVRGGRHDVKPEDLN